MEILIQKITSIPGKIRSISFADFFQSVKGGSLRVFSYVKDIGVAEKMDDYEKRKLTIFNQLNFFQLIVGILIPFLGMFHNDKLPTSAWMLACLPSTISVGVLILNYLEKYDVAQLS